MKSKNYFEVLEKKINEKKCLVGIVGVGYVGLNLLIQFNKKKINTIGFDTNIKKINMLKKNLSPITYLKKKDLKFSKNFSEFDYSYKRINTCDVIIICLPTPVKKNTQPDLSNITNFINKIKNKLSSGKLIILESTTYPGTTREEIVEKFKSKFYLGKEIFIAYSPERENPGSKIKFFNIPKVLSGFSKNCTDLSKKLYGLIVKKTVKANTLEEAEMTKLLENIYRSVNIGLVNELKIICKSMNLNIKEVIKLAATKPFGFTKFLPGPGVGGHCIPIDPYYLYWRAKKFNQNSKFIEIAGRVNIETTIWTVKNIIKILKKHRLKNPKVLILGIAYKKNIEDTRESAGIKMISELMKKRIKVEFSDPYVKAEKVDGKKKISINLYDKNIKKFDCIVLVTDHDRFNYKKIIKNAKIIIDCRGRLSRKNNFYQL